MNSHLIDMEGRLGFKKQFPFMYIGYHHLGQSIHNLEGVSKIVKLDQNQANDVPLHPQRTVVQFNSTYLETTGRNDRRRGDATAIGLLLMSLMLYMVISMIKSTLLIMSEAGILGNLYMLMLITMVTIGIIYLGIMLSSELFTSRHQPIRFNRKTGKIYVRQANRRVETYDWQELTFFIAHLKEDMDIRAVTLDSDDTITGMFALPFHGTASERSILKHFEFIRCYMSDDEQEFLKAKQAVRYIYPIHAKRESPVLSFQRMMLQENYFTHMDLEYPEKAYFQSWSLIIILPFLWLRYLGRILSMLTCYRHRYSPEIEAECHIDPNDPHDLNKHLPEGNRQQQQQPLWKTVAYGILTLVATIAMLFVFAFFINIMGEVRPHGDYPSMVEKLWHLVSFGWLK